MEKFYLFAGAVYYPDGGAADLQGTFSTLVEAQRALQSKEVQENLNWTHSIWAHVANSELKIISEWNSHTEEFEPYQKESFRDGS